MIRRHVSRGKIKATATLLSCYLLPNSVEKGPLERDKNMLVMKEVEDVSVVIAYGQMA